MGVNFYECGGTNYVSIEDGHKAFNEAITAKSPNGKYCVAAGYWHINDEDSENDGDEIDGSAETIIFENEQILYRAKSTEDAEDFAIRDDGKLCILEDRCVSVWPVSGSPVKKRFAFDYYDAGINADFAWASGDGDDGNVRLSVYIFDTGKMWTKRLSDDISIIKAVLMVKDAQYRIYAVAGTYEKGDTVILYDAEGKKMEITADDLYKVLALLPHCEPEAEPVEHTEAAPPTAPTQKKKGFLAKLFGT